ncbi:MAG: hypothetical protein Q4C87_01740 [Actinomycetaceae bacterium]|nr:hypothetical protein [Actinomycetaceae bacterium]
MTKSQTIWRHRHSVSTAKSRRNTVATDKRPGLVNMAMAPSRTMRPDAIGTTTYSLT